MASKVLVLGAQGFLGRHVAQYFKSEGVVTYGLGHGGWEKGQQCEWGVDNWLSGDINVESLKSMRATFDTIVHCAGGAEVGYSLNEPMKDFQRTVQSTLSVVEYMRLYNPKAKLIYPSSAAVQGACIDKPIKEGDVSNPVSPYGVHKKVAEEICLSYVKNFGLNITIIRFFSIYGNHLKKQLLWDASSKLIDESEQAIFWGTGQETRDWIHVSDAVSLIAVLSENSVTPQIVNGGSGKRHTINEVLKVLRNALIPKKQFTFNQETRAGDPAYYWADITKARSLGWAPTVTIEDGISQYAEWFNSIK